jgi:AcrR family transcriptional regulator
MASETTRKPQRRRPRQARSRATLDAILEATARILERRGVGAFTTNQVAERAGVSIGTLYQYFADKEAVLLAALRRELDALPRRQRALIEALISLVEGAGRAAATGERSANARPIVKPKSNANWRRQAFELAMNWLSNVSPAPLPGLRPVPIHRPPPWESTR